LANQVGSISTTGTVTVYDTTSVSPHGPSGVTVGPDGNIWFDELFASAVGTLNLSTKSVSALKVTSGKVNGPISIITGPDKNLWTTSFDGPIEKITTAGVVTTYAITGSGSGPLVSFNGQVYFGEGTSIGHITTAGVQGSAIKAPSGGTIEALTVGPDGNLWFTELNSAANATNNFYGYVTPAGAIKEFPVAKTYGNVTGIAAPADGKIYFRAGDYLVGTSTAGAIFLTQSLGTGSSTSSHDLITGPDGNLWFTESFNDEIGVAYVAGGLVGTVTATGGKAVAGVTVFIDAKHTGTYASGDPTTTTSAAGTYRFNEVPGTYVVGVVTPSGDKLTTAAEVTLTVAAGGTATANFGLTPTVGAPTIGVTTPDTTAAEGLFGSPASTGLFAVTREAGGTGAVTVDLTLAGTATYNVDYKVAVFGGTYTYNATTKALDITLAAGSTGAAVEITPLTVAATEVAQTVVLSLASSTSYTEDTTKLSGTVTIAAH
jgi:virginiamycin B lyase